MAALGKNSARIGLVVAGFSFIWKFVNNTLELLTKRQSKTNGAIAGALAGVCIIFETAENRKEYVQQLTMRALLAGKNALKQRNVL